MDTDVVVLGAGLAGLQCARRLQRSGLSVQVLEKSDAVGGRVRTDEIDGFLCDRGFQVLNPAYPAVRKWIDVSALGLQRFGVGAMVRSSEGMVKLAHPLRHPRHLAATLRSGLLDPGEIAAVLRWIGPTLLRPSAAADAASDTTLEASLNEAGATGRLRREVLDTFLAGVLADSSGETSANFARLLVRSFVLGAPGLPQQGMQALPRQMAASLSAPPPVGDRRSLAPRDRQWCRSRHRSRHCPCPSGGGGRGSGIGRRFHRCTESCDARADNVVVPRPGEPAAGEFLGP